MADKRPVAVTNPLFKALVWFVAILCLATLLIGVLLALFGREPPTEAQRSLLELCKYGFTTTLGTLVGLLGGRAGGPDRLDELPTAKKPVARKSPGSPGQK